MYFPKRQTVKPLSSYCFAVLAFSVLALSRLKFNALRDFFFFPLFVGLIEYNFHCFRKAIHEVFEVGTAPQDVSSSSNNPTGLKYATLNGSAV